MALLVLDVRFQGCCKRALEASLLLASRVSGKPAEKLDEMYRDACSSGRGCFSAHDFATDQDAFQEIEMHGEAQHQGEHAETNEAAQLLSGIQQEAEWVRTQNDVGEDKEEEIEEEEDMTVKNMPDKKAFLQMCQEQQADPDLSKSSSKLPSSLLEAVKSDGDLWNCLFRYSLMLRCDAGGCDRAFLPNPRNTRKAAKSLNWHQ